VSRSGPIDWLSFPRFDSPAFFARLLVDRADHWSVASMVVRQRYTGPILAMETSFATPTSTATLTDALAVGPNERGHELGGGAPSFLLRLVTGVRESRTCS
jgi:GH15 family glucan-1,4-alpha-glucosidase